MALEATRGSAGPVVDFQEAPSGVSTISPNIPKVEDPESGTGFIADAKTKAPDADIKTRWNKGSGLLTASKAEKVADAKPATIAEKAGFWSQLAMAYKGIELPSKEDADFTANMNTILDQAGGEDKKALS